MENSIRRHDFKHEDDAMQTIWRIAYGEMMSSNTIWMMACIRRYDVTHEENAMQTMWRAAYGHMMGSMRRMP